MKASKTLLPLIILLAGAMGAWGLMANRPQVKSEKREEEPPVVEVVVAQKRALRLTVHSQGIVKPRTEITLASEVPGRVIEVHRAFAAGGFFEQGEVLVVIDPRDYAFAVTQAQAEVAEAHKELLREEAEAEQARQEWRALGGGQASAFVLREPHLAERRAKLAAAKDKLAEARLNRARCELYAPFAGRVRSKQVDVGHYVSTGEALARIYAIDVAEVRLPIPSEQIDFLDLPLSYRGGAGRRAGPPVDLSARLGDREHRWEGRIVRTEGAFDDKTGMLYAVAEVADPYGYSQHRPPLAVGLFVQAQISGRERSDLLRLPHGALRAGHQVLVIDAEHRVRFRDVEVLANDPEGVLVRGGIAPGERVAVAGLDTPAEGMRVRLQASDSRL